jgi:hypothetical protein
MNNGFRPTVGQKVKVVGNCHPRMLGKIVEVTFVDDESVESKFYDDLVGEEVFTSGKHGGFEPVTEESRPA